VHYQTSLDLEVSIVFINGSLNFVKQSKQNTRCTDHEHQN